MCEVMDHVLTIHMAQAIWDEINTMFGTSTYARTVNTNIAIATTNELLGMTMSEYAVKMKDYGDKMMSAGHILEGEDMGMLHH
jgi:hypothetical protein